MINDKFIRAAAPFAIFAAVSWLLRLYDQHFLWIFPAYGFIFIWFYFFQDKELKFVFIFLATAIGFVLPRAVSQGRPVEAALLSFGEVAALWALFYALHSAQNRRQASADLLQSKLEAHAGRARGLESEIRMYTEHREALRSRIKFQAGLSVSIQTLSACATPDEIKTRLQEMLKRQFPGVTADFESGAPRDFLANWVAQRKIPLLVRNSAEENRLSAGVFAEGQRSLVVVPLNLFGSIAGFIRLVSSEPNRFATPDLRTLEIISTIATVSMENLYMFDRVRQLAIKDGLTGLFTHRAFQTRVEEEVLRSARTKVPFSLLMADIDHFKSYNDTYGHQAGDAVLKAVAQTLSEGVRDIDFTARYGGEEFAVILTGVGKVEAAGVAEHLRKTLEDRRFSFGGAVAGVTASFGVAEFPGEAAISSQLVRAADERLYRAKKTGRNRVVYE
ncbi:MAG: sensor domain-containing diguanylate cyclase [Elusimicrobiales bacterium]|jgi:diguanylate cyclase (GGDEF)-like protein